MRRSFLTRATCSGGCGGVSFVLEIGPRPSPSSDDEERGPSEGFGPSGTRGSVIGWRFRRCQPDIVGSGFIQRNLFQVLLKLGKYAGIALHRRRQKHERRKKFKIDGRTDHRSGVNIGKSDMEADGIRLLRLV